jgi:hypothetical protein
MRTLPKGSIAPLSVAPLAPVVPASSVDTVSDLDILHVTVSFDDGPRHHAGVPRTPSNVEVTAEKVELSVEEDEILVADPRGGVTPAEMVELKLRSLLRSRGVSTELAGKDVPVRGRSVRR